MIAKLRLSVVEYGDQLGEAFTRLGILDAVSRKVLLVAEEQGELVPTFREQEGTSAPEKKGVDQSPLSSYSDLRSSSGK